MVHSAPLALSGHLIAVLIGVFLFKLVVMIFLEKELEDFLFEMLEDFREELNRRGFKVSKEYDEWIYYRQLNLGGYGIADIVGFKKEKLENGETEISVHVI